MITIQAYTKDKVLDFPLEEFFKLKNTPEFDEIIFWVDLDNPTPDEEKIILADFFSFHQLAIQDCQRERLNPERGDHYPKVEDYSNYIFVIFNPVGIPVEHEHNSDVKRYKRISNIHFPTKQINTFLGSNYVVTHHYEPSDAISYVRGMCSRNPQILKRGTDFVFHLVIDEIVDDYSPVMEFLDNFLDTLEASIFKNPHSITLSRILSLKKGIIRLKRITSYQKEILSRLSRGEFTLVSSEETFYYRNVYDHLVRISDIIDAYRESASNLVEMFLSVTSNKLNQVMRILTVISTIFLPLTFISSIYGMNFVHMPELQWRYGYLFVWIVILIIGTGMVFYIKRRGWLE